MTDLSPSDSEKPDLKNWVIHFPYWHDWIGGFFGGLNWMLPERELLQIMREEIMIMVKVIDKRLQELSDKPEQR